MSDELIACVCKGQFVLIFDVSKLVNFRLFAYRVWGGFVYLLEIIWGQLNNLICGIIEFDVDCMTNVIENGMASK